MSRKSSMPPTKKSKKTGKKSLGYVKSVIKMLNTKNMRLTLNTIFQGSIPSAVTSPPLTVDESEYKNFLHARKKMIDEARANYIMSLKPSEGTNASKAASVFQTLMNTTGALEALPSKMPQEVWSTMDRETKWKHMTNQTASSAANPYALNL